VAIDREKILAAAQKYVEKKRYDRAVAEYQRIIQEDPNDARILLKIGDLQSKMEAYADAIVTYERVGKFYSSQGFSLKAIAVFKQIREIIAKHVPQLEDKYSHITPKLAELYQALGLTSDALQALDEVATRLQRQSREGEALEVFGKIVKLDPTNPLPHLRLAEALLRAKDVDECVAEFGIAAGLLAKLGRRDDAIKVLDRLLSQKPDPTHARTTAELLLARGGANDGMLALSKLQICFQANQRDLDTLGLLSRAFNVIGQAAKAIEVQKEMARIARDGGNKDLFRDLVGKLQKLAPNDEGVRKLATSSVAPGPASSAPPPAPKSETSVSTSTGTGGGTSSYDDVDSVDIGDSEIEDAPRGGIGAPPPARPLATTATSEADSEVVVETSVQVVEEVLEPPTTAGAKAQIMRILADAESFRHAGFLAKAVESLQIGLELAPKSMALRELLRDILIEARQPLDAADEMIAIAELLIDGLDGEAAAHSLQEALAIDPDNQRAAAMLRELGYELVEEPEPYEVTAQGDPRPPSARARTSSYDPEAPLPSYDLEEIGPEEVAARRPSSSDLSELNDPNMRTVVGSLDGSERVQPPPSARRANAATNMGEIDDPFGDGALPSFPLDAPPDSAAAFDLVGDATDDLDDEGADGRTVIGAPDPALMGVGRAPVAASPGGAPDIESALEEADFFASRGLYDDARAILDEQLARLPNHPLLVERLAELEVQEHGVQGVSGTRPSPSAGDDAHREDRAFDIAESLGTEGDRSSGVGPSFGGAGDQVDVEDLFAKFKEGVAKQIDVDDGQSHYDLGVAYKEMGLLADAIREFDTAARDPKRACVCNSMIGTIHLERGELNEAIAAFMRGLESPDRTKEQEVSLLYEVGSAYEVKRMVRQALDHFQRAARMIPSFRDVQERVRRLQKSEPKAPVRAAAVGADDEFDRAFDDILGQSKLP
jgi:tetratricopeptide (TPR) repeat protein